MVGLLKVFNIITKFPQRHHEHSHHGLGRMYKGTVCYLPKNNEHRYKRTNYMSVLEYLSTMLQITVFSPLLSNLLIKVPLVLRILPNVPFFLYLNMFFSLNRWND